MKLKKELAAVALSGFMAAGCSVEHSKQTPTSANSTLNKRNMTSNLTVYTFSPAELPELKLKDNQTYVCLHTSNIKSSTTVCEVVGPDGPVR